MRNDVKYGMLFGLLIGALICVGYGCAGCNKVDKSDYDKAVADKTTAETAKATAETAQKVAEAAKATADADRKAATNQLAGMQKQINDLSTQIAAAVGAKDKAEATTGGFILPKNQPLTAKQAAHVRKYLAPTSKRLHKQFTKAGIKFSVSGPP